MKVCSQNCQLGNVVQSVNSQIKGIYGGEHYKEKFLCFTLSA